VQWSLGFSRSSSSAAAHSARRKLQPFMRGTPGKVAPLLLWLHDRAMHIGTCLFVHATTARNKPVTHQESGGVGPSIVRIYNISLHRTGIDKVHAPNCLGGLWYSVHAPQVRRPAAELGR
jgi:hypothetical protein